MGVDDCGPLQDGGMVRYELVSWIPVFVTMCSSKVVLNYLSETR